MRNKVAYYIGLAFIVLQIALIIHARFIPERFFCWAPYDEHNYFEVRVFIDGKDLTANEIEQRYQYKSVGWENRTMHNIFNLITQYERTYGIKDNAKVEVHYVKNGHPEQIWYLDD